MPSRYAQTLGDKGENEAACRSPSKHLLELMLLETDGNVVIYIVGNFNLRFSKSHKDVGRLGKLDLPHNVQGR